MEKNRVKIDGTHPKNKKSFHSALRYFDLPDLFDKMKHENSWYCGELNAKVLLKRPDKQIVLTVLHDNTVIESFQSNDSIAFQIIEGKLKFHVRNESITLNKGQLLTMHDNAKYSLSSKEDTVFLLTIVNSLAHNA